MDGAHWTFAEQTARIGIQLLLVNPTIRFSGTIYPGLTTAFSGDPHLSDEQREAWERIRAHVYRRVALENGLEPPTSEGK